jgi:hypothetical protein
MPTRIGPMREAERQPWRVRVLGPRGPVGAGFLVDQRHVLTCAHVVANALDVPDDGPRPVGTVQVDFAPAGPSPPIPAHVREEGWTPVGADDRGDVAVLELQGDLPGSVGPAPLRQPARLRGRAVSTFGYPRGIEHGEWAHATVSGFAGPSDEWVQLDGTTVTGRRIERGFSGAAVYDQTARGVVGMVVAEDKQAEVKIAWMIPVEVLARAWPPLADLVPSRLRLDPEFRRHWEPRGRGVERHIHDAPYVWFRSRGMAVTLSGGGHHPRADHRRRIPHPLTTRPWPVHSVTGRPDRMEQLENAERRA